MTVKIQMEIYDEEQSERLGQVGVIGVNFEGMTLHQGEAAMAYLNAIERKLGKAVDEMKKYGTGDVIPEPEDNVPDTDMFADDKRKVAMAEEKRKVALAKENTKADSDDD